MEDVNKIRNEILTMRLTVIEGEEQEVVWRHSNLKRNNLKTISI